MSSVWAMLDLSVSRSQKLRSSTGAWVKRSGAQERRLPRGACDLETGLVLQLFTSQVICSPL